MTTEQQCLPFRRPEGCCCGLSKNVRFMRRIIFWKVMAITAALLYCGQWIGLPIHSARQCWHLNFDLNTVCSRPEKKKPPIHRAEAKTPVLWLAHATS